MLPPSSGHANLHAEPPPPAVVDETPAAPPVELADVLVGPVVGPLVAPPAPPSRARGLPESSTVLTQSTALAAHTKQSASAACAIAAVVFRFTQPEWTAFLKPVGKMIGPSRSLGSLKAPSRVIGLRWCWPLTVASEPF
jgi:hypothetical protein